MTSGTSPQAVVHHFVMRAKRLYSLPAVAMRVLELTGETTVDTQALTECIENDPALSAKILRVVNSSVYGLSQRVGNIKQAVAMLGTRPLKILVLGFSLPSNLGSGSSTEVLGRYWRHTLFKAVAAREIAEGFYRIPADDAFLGGLLQNLGILVLVQDLGATYEKFLLSVWDDGGDLAIEETNVLGFDHRFLSARLFEHWRFPQDFVSAVGMPRSVEQLRGLDPAVRSLPQILHMADLIASFLMDARPQLLDLLLRIGHPYCGLTMAQLESLMSALEEKAPQFADVLSLELPGDVSYATVLQNAYQRLTDVLDSATAALLDSTCRPRDIVAARELSRHVAESVSRGEPDDTASELKEDAFLATQSSEVPSGEGSDPKYATSCQAGHEPKATDRAPRPLRSTTFRWTTREGLIGRIAVEIGRCRQTRSSISLLLVELDEFEKATFFCGIDRIPQVIKRLGVTIRDVTEAADSLYQIDDARFAVVLNDCERQRAVGFAWQIVDGIRLWKYSLPNRLQAALTVSVGLASLSMPPRNFPAEEILTAAQRCLSGVQLSGGNGVKSIDIF